MLHTVTYKNKEIIMDFYEKTGGVTLLVIQHHGSNFSYVNGRRHNNYFSQWQILTPFMKPEKYYVIACLVNHNYVKTSFIPFGIVLELDSEEEAKKVSFEHRKQVENNTWDATKEYIKLKNDWLVFVGNFIKETNRRIEKNEQKGFK